MNRRRFIGYASILGGTAALQGCSVLTTTNKTKSLRNSPSRELNADVIIIGGGVVGCATARELSRFRLNIALLEGAPDLCAGQSKANTAIVHAGYDAKQGSNKARFNVLGNAMFEQLTRELDVPFEQNGSLVLAFSQEGIPALQAERRLIQCKLKHTHLS